MKLTAGHFVPFARYEVTDILMNKVWVIDRWTLCTFRKIRSDGHPYEQGLGTPYMYQEVIDKKIISSSYCETKIMVVPKSCSSR